MLNTMLYAKLFGLYLFIMAVVMLACPKRMQKHITGLNANSDHLFCGGAFTLLLGLLVVLTHNVWVKDWRVFITLIGWISVIKGVCLVACPEMIVGKCKDMYKGNGYYVSAFITLAVAAVLISASFFNFKFCIG